MAVVLCYHRVAESDWDPFGLSVPPELFDRHLDVLRSRTTIVPLIELEPADGVVAITFDDGYVDNAEIVAPKLVRESVPATFFVCSDFLEAPRPYWWDLLTRLVETRRGSDPVTVPLLGSRFSVGGSETECLTGLLRMHQLLLPLPVAQIEEEINVLAERLHVETPSDPGAISMTAERLRELARSDLFEIGSHSSSHPFLPSQSEGDTLREIAESRLALQEWCEIEVTSFSYPFGAHDERVRTAVREAGYTRSCTVESGALGRATDPFLLPRVVVPPISAEELALLISDGD